MDLRAITSIFLVDASLPRWSASRVTSGDRTSGRRIGRIAATVVAAATIGLAAGCADLGAANSSPEAKAAVGVPVPTSFAMDAPGVSPEVIAEVAKLSRELSQQQIDARLEWNLRQMDSVLRDVDRAERTSGTALNDLRQKEFEASLLAAAGGEEAEAAAKAEVNYRQQAGQLKQILVEDGFAEAQKSYDDETAPRSETYSVPVAAHLFDGGETGAERDQVATDLLAVCDTRIRGAQPFEARRFLRAQLDTDERTLTIAFTALASVCPKYQPDVLAVLDEIAAEQAT